MPVYLQSAQYAIEHGDLDEYRNSRALSEECRDAIDKAISENFDGGTRSTKPFPKTSTGCV